MPIEYKKGPLGIMADMRGAMARIETSAGMWCRAYDQGDTGAIETVWVILIEAIEDFTAASKKLQKRKSSRPAG